MPTFEKNAIPSYRARDLENAIVVGSHIGGFHIWAIPVRTKHERGRLTIMTEGNEEKMSIDARLLTDYNCPSVF